MPQWLPAHWPTLVPGDGARVQGKDQDHLAADAFGGVSRSTAKHSVTLSAATFTESRARCAYWAVIWTLRWPRSFRTIGRLSPRERALDAKEWRRSWRPRNGAATAPDLVYQSWLLRVRCPRCSRTVAARRGRGCTRMRVVGPGGSWLERSCREGIGVERRRDGVWTAGKAHPHPTQAPRLSRTSTRAGSGGAKDWETTGVNRS